MDTRTTKLRISHLFKVFGPNPDDAMELAKTGVDKDEVFRRTSSVVAVNDVSIDIAAREICVVMGLSGSGKSTLVRCLNRLIEPSGGRIEVDGENVVEFAPDALRDLRKRRIAMVFQHFALLPHKTVVDNVAYGLKVRGTAAAERREKALEALSVVGLDVWADAYPHNLSGGMQQRVGLARALAVDPEILLMDEPFSALDPLIRREMQAELLEIQKRIRTTIVFITHDLHEALTLGDKVAIMKDGAFVQVGPPDDIVSNPADDYVASFTQDVDRSRVISLSRIARPDPATVKSDATLAQARRVVHNGVAGAFVVDSEGTPTGFVNADDLASAPARGRIDGLVRDIAALSGDAPIHSAFAACAEDKEIALVDERGRLTGSVARSDIFGSLAAGA